MRTRPIQNNFSAGVLSPNTLGLVGTDVYSSGLQVGKNITVETMGGIKRRAGSEFITHYANVDYMRIFPFTFNRDQAYVIVIVLDVDSTSQMDIYRDNVLVSSNIVVPYGTAQEIKEIDFAQSADSMIFTQGDNAIYYLRRLGDDSSWDFIPVPITNPPQYTPDATPVDMWTAILGYPKHCTFHQGRLWFAGSKTFPQNLWASKSQDFFNFDLGSQGAGDSIQEALDTDFINPITAIFSARQLQVFTRGDEFSNPATVLTPDTSYWVRQSNYGSAYDVPPVSVDGATLFVDSTGRTIRNFTYSDERSGYDSPSISSRAEHLVKEPQRMGVLRGGALQPANFVYAINVDGTLALLNVSKAHNLLAWTEWETQGFYRDVVTIGEDVYMLVQRYLSTAGEYVTHDGEFVTHDGELVYVGVDPQSNVKLDWVLERMSDVMLVDSGKLQSNVVDDGDENINKSANYFFGVYFNPDGSEGKAVIVKLGVIIYINEFLQTDPKKPYMDVDGVLYITGDIFSYNEDVRELYFDEELGYQWYMYAVHSKLTIDSGKNYIEGLEHLIGLECVSTLDGNIQEPQNVVAGESVITVEKSYPDGNVWIYDVDNMVFEYIVDDVIFQTNCIYGGVLYENVILTDYGYLISGVVGEIGSVYLEAGVTFEVIVDEYGVEIFDANGTFRTAIGETSVTVCMVGGGASGGFSGDDIISSISFGGKRGDVVSISSNAVDADTNLNVVVGSGGAKRTTIGEVGNAGTQSSFNGLVASGGSGGHSGNGASKTTCGGTKSDGLKLEFGFNSVLWGGESSGFANGGNANTDGFKGSGAGGAYGEDDGNTGGDGRVVITHSVSIVQTKKSYIRKVQLVESIVTGGIITYEDAPYNVGQAGLFFPVVAKTMPINVSAGGGSLVNEPKRIVSITSRFKDTQAVTVNGIDIPEREFGEEVLDFAPALVTGIEKNRHLGYNRETTVLITQNDPMPFTLLSIDVEVNF